MGSEKATPTEKLTKRKRRSIPNPATKWVQHPKITSPAARARAYLVDAGLHNNSSKKSSSSSELDPKLDLNSPEVKFGKMIGGTSEKERHKAIQMLRGYLRARCDIENESGGICELDLMKLWKGMWHTLYMADKVPVQDALSKHLAKLMWSLAGTEEEDEYAAQVYLDMDEQIQQQARNEDGHEEEEEESDDEDFVMNVVENTLEESDEDDDDEDFEEDGDDETDSSNEMVEDQEDDDENNSNDEDIAEEVEEEEVGYATQKHCRGAHLVSLYIRTFFRTVKREWGNMDKHRVDKFYTAIRFMIHEMYKYMSSRHWNIGIIRLFNDALFEEVLSQTPNGLRLHLIDITIPELAKVNSNSPLPLTEATFLDCLEPYFAMAQTSEDKIVQSRVMENVLEKFLTEFSFVCGAAVQLRENGKQKEDEAEQKIFDQVHVGTVAQFIFGIASDADTADRYRKQLYEMHKMYLRKIKAAGTDVEMDVGNGGDDEEKDYNEVEDEVVGDDEVVPEITVVDGSGENDKKDVTPAEDVAEEDVEKDAEKKSSAKKEKKRRKKKKSKDEDKVTNDKEKSDKKSSRKDEEAKKVEETKKTEPEKTEEESNNQDAETPSSSKKKKKKKKKNKRTTNEDGDEVITISQKEQSKAAKAAKSNNSTPKKKTNENSKKNLSPPAVDPKAMIDSDNVMSDIETDGVGPPPSITKSKKKKKSVIDDDKDRRVSFGRVNHSKSYKASMKALKTMEHPSSACKTPDRSILLNKRKGMDDDSGPNTTGKKAKRAKGLKNMPRKRAIDYF